MLGNGNRVVIELSERLAPLVPVDEPHFLYASDGASAVEQALKIAFQYWVNIGSAGRSTFLAFGGAYHGDTLGALSVGDRGFGTDIFDPLTFPVVRAAGVHRPEVHRRGVRPRGSPSRRARRGDRGTERAGCGRHADGRAARLPEAATGLR